jgi:hypothetical protein
VGTRDCRRVLSYVPEVPDDFGVRLDFDVRSAEEGVPGTFGYFSVYVCSPKHLDRWLDAEEMKLGRHLVLMKRWEPQRVVGFINDFVERIEAETWEELAELISRIAAWEDELPAYMDWERY